MTNNAQVNNIKFSDTRTSTIVSNTVDTIFLLNPSFNSYSAAIISAMASRRRTASSFSLGNDEDAREKKRKGLCVNVVTGVDATVERDGQKTMRVAGDHADDAVRARKDIIVKEEVGSGGCAIFYVLVST